MPAWMTPELWPVWCCAIVGSRSRTVTVWPRLWSSRATARPTMPAPTTAMSVVLGAADRASRLVELDRLAQPVLERDLGLEAHQLAGARDVEEALRLAVGSRRVPDGLALEAGQVVDQLSEVADARLDAGADVDGLGGLEALGGEQQRAGGVIDKEELARRRAGPPHRHLGVAVVARLDVLADHRRDHVGVLEVEVV